jgi:hypothetical protein
MIFFGDVGKPYKITWLTDQKSTVCCVAELCLPELGSLKAFPTRTFSTYNGLPGM